MGDFFKPCPSRAKAGFKRSVQTDSEKKMAEDFRTTLSVQNSGCPTESDQFG
jgi:hypothetical protein